MKKTLITCLTAVALLINTPMPAKAATLDEMYKSAYDATIAVTELAKKNGVKPYWQEGPSDFSNVVTGVQNGLQRDILSARAKVVALPASIQLMKNTLSSMLDSYQHPVYEKTVEGINKLQKANLTSYTVRDNAYDACVAFQSNDTLIQAVRLLIKDMPAEYKASYSSAIDQYQQSAINAAINFVKLVETSKDSAFKSAAALILNNMKINNKNNQDVVNFLNIFIDQNANTVVNNPISDKDLLSLATKYGFKNISFSNDDATAPTMLQDSNFSHFLITPVEKSFCISGTSSNMQNFKALFTELMPYQSDTIVQKVKTLNSTTTINSNGLQVSITVDSTGNKVLLKFLKLDV